MKRKANSKSIVIEPGGVDEYIKQCPKDIQPRLQDIRGAIRQAAPGSTETVSYFQMPGYSYEGSDYNGMFAWFSFKAPNVRLHVRPPVLEDNIKHLGDYSTTKAVISFPCTISRNGPVRFRINGPTLHGLPAEPRFECSTRPFSLKQVFGL